MKDLHVGDDGHARMYWEVASRSLIGYRAEFLTRTRGTGTLTHRFLRYGERQAPPRMREQGVLVVQEDCQAVAYALMNLQERGKLFIGPGERVYAGQVVGLNSRAGDMLVNPAKGKKLTNHRAAGSDDLIQLTPPVRMGLEDALEFIAPDELVEVTPDAIRVRKRLLAAHERKRAAKQA